MRLATINSFNFVRRIPVTPTPTHHYDPSNTSSLTVISGRVDAMNDLAGNAPVYAASATRRPYLETIDGRGMLYHGTAYNTSMNNIYSSADVTLANHTVVAVVKTDQARATSGGTAGFFSHCASDNNGRVTYYAMGNYFGGFDVGTDGFGSGFRVASINGNVNIFCAVLNNTAPASQRIEMSINDGNPRYVGITATYNFSRRIVIGSVFIHNNRYEGHTGEILLFNSALSSAERQQAIGYLAHKWGLANNLPSSHPYRFLPPSRLPV